MNLTWHIIKKDLVRMRLHLLLWTVFLGGQVFVSARLLSIRSVDYNWFTETGMRLNLLMVIGVAICFIMAAALVLADPLVGTDMAWVTRPISGGRLLRAKLLLALLMFGLLPVLIWIPWWLYCDFSVGDMACAAGRVLCVQAFAVIPAFVLASLLGETGRFVLFSVLMVVVVLVAALNFVTWGDYSALSPDLLQTRLLLAVGLLVVCGAVVVWRQYLTRQLVSSAVILTGGIVLAAAIAVCWPWNIMNVRPENAAQMARSEGISAEIQEMRIAALGNTGVLVNTTAPEDIGVTIKIRFKGVPDDVSLSSGLADVELRWPDGGTIQRRSLKMISDYWSEVNEGSSVLMALGLPPGHDWLHHWDPETNAKQAEMTEAWRRRAVASGGYWREPGRHPGEAQLKLTLAVTPGMATKIQANPPACSISARVMVKKPKLLFEMPLRGDTWMAGEGARLHVLAVVPQVWRNAGREETKSFLVEVVAASAPGLNGLSLYSVDRNHGTAFFQGRTYPFSVVPVAANIEGLYFTLMDPRLWRTDKWIEPAGWLESSTLAAVTYKRAGGFDRDLHTDRLVLGKDGDN